MEQPVAQQQGLAGLVDDFRKAWQSAREPASTVDLRRFLVAETDPNRTACLYGLIKIDQEMRWQRGQGMTLESYLQQFPELGKAEKLPPRVVYEEYRIRQIYGDQPTLADYQKRFPAQYPEVQRLIEQESAVSSGTLAPFNETPAPPRSMSDKELVPWPSAPTAPVSSAQSQAQSIPAVGGGYKLQKCIGRGAYGEVWRAEAPGGVEVAVKIIFGSVSQEEAAKREHRALELMKRLRHAYLLPIHAAWQMEDRLVIAMQLADGSLRDLFKEKTKPDGPGMPPEELVSRFREAAEAMDYLHANNVLHRDIKPENILLLGGHAMVADFGLARVLEQSGRLMAASTCGTPAFMAPETIQGTSGEASDQYSLAAAYVELRLNRSLFQGRSLFELMQDHLNTKPDLTGLEEEEQQVCHKALAKDPKERYPSCKEFVLALEYSLAPKRQEIVEPPSKGSRLLAIGMVLLLAVAAGVSTWFAWHNRGEIQPPLVPTFEVELDPTGQTVPAGGSALVTVKAKRINNMDQPIRLTLAGLPAGLRAAEIPPAGTTRVAPLNAPPGMEFTIPADQTTQQIEILAAPDVAPAQVQLTIEASAGDKSEARTMQISIAPLDYFLPDKWQRSDNAVLTRVGKRVYYDKIDVIKGDQPVRFVLIPKSRSEDPETFYIMQDKVSAGLFRRYLEEVKRKPLTPLPWDKYGDKCPALGLFVMDAYGFASEWLQGNLPTLEQWDKAAGRYEPNRGEGPYEGTWNPQDPQNKQQFAVGLNAPLQIGTSTKESIFHVRDMAGNGQEWTRTIAVYGGRKRLVPELKDGDSVETRGWGYGNREPLTFKELEENQTALPKPMPDLGFRAVIETHHQTARDGASSP